MLAFKCREKDDAMQHYSALPAPGLLCSAHKNALCCWKAAPDALSTLLRDTFKLILPLFPVARALIVRNSLTRIFNLEINSLKSQNFTFFFFFYCWIELENRECIF